MASAPWQGVGRRCAGIGRSMIIGGARRDLRTGAPAPHGRIAAARDSRRDHGVRDVPRRPPPRRGGSPLDQAWPGPSPHRRRASAAASPGSDPRHRRGIGLHRTAIALEGRARCRSSGVEHSLGKGEAESSNLSGSTMKSDAYERAWSAVRASGPFPGLKRPFVQGLFRRCLPRMFTARSSCGTPLLLLDDAP